MKLKKFNEYHDSKVDDILSKMSDKKPLSEEEQEYLKAASEDDMVTINRIKDKKRKKLFDSEVEDIGKVDEDNIYTDGTYTFYYDHSEPEYNGDSIYYYGTIMFENGDYYEGFLCNEDAEGTNSPCFYSGDPNGDPEFSKFIYIYDLIDSEDYYELDNFLHNTVMEIEEKEK